MKGAVLAYGYSSKGINLQNDFNLTSDLFDEVGQSGELFGHQIVVADFNRDGLDDVIVSAPLWSRFPKSGISPLSNIGRVYYFEQAKSGRKLNGTWITRDDFIPKVVCTNISLYDFN